MLFSLAIAGACDGREITSSTPILHPRRGFDDAAPPAPSAIGSGSVSEGSPSTALGTGPGASWVIVRVSGSMTARHNPACDTLSLNFPCQTGDPVGKFSAEPSDEGPVQVWTQDGPWFPGKILLRGAGGGAIGLHHQANDGPVWAVLNVSNPIPSSSNPGTPPHSYILDGGYEVSAEAVPSPMQIDATDPDSTGARTYTIQPLYGLQIDQPVYVGWQFVPGDSVSQYTIGAEGAWDLWDCYGQGRTTCTWAPPPGVNGRMQAWTYMEGQQVTGRSDYVHRSGGPLCSSSIPRGGATLDLSGSGCQNQEPRISVRCDPTSVLRGATIRCDVSASPPGATATKIQWLFVDSVGHNISGPSDSTHWGGTMVISGTVKVTAVVSQGTSTDSAQIHVGRRKWSSLRLEVVNDGQGTLPPPEAVRFQWQLAQTRLLARPDTELVVGTIDSGPNTGWAYVPTAVRIRAAVDVNTAWNRGSAWYNLQKTGPTGQLDGAGNATHYCATWELAPALASALDHEGLTHGPIVSHIDVFKDWFKNHPDQDSIEAAIRYRPDLLPSETAASSIANGEMARIVDRAFADPDQRHTNDIIPGRVQPAIWPCQMRFFP